MQIRSGSVFFPRGRGSGPRTATQTFIFPRDVERAVAGLTGYSVGFAGGDDHHLGNLDIRTDIQTDRNVAIVTATLGLRDWSGSWDDDYEGTVQFAVLADLVSATGPTTPSRADLAVTGLEINQAIQHFRSFQHLDGPNVRPDNSIRLIARKNTGVRVYVDYDLNSGLPRIFTLSGTLEVMTSVGSTTITLSPVSIISPRRDNQINRADAGHTLNFVIPEAWCQGELTLRCWVFDSTSPDLQRSATFQRTIRFEDVAPLRIYGVGVHYTGQSMDLAAPTQTQVMQTFSFVESTYPVGEALLTGYSTIDFDEDMRANIDDGCGDGFGTLLDRLRDMRGSSTDIYYAVLPSGIDSGSVGGCGGRGAGAGFIGGGATAAQEIGHAFGLDHAPCDSESRCGNPSDQDSNYPQYNGFASDSIGEFGYDPATNRVFDPANAFDFMGYSGPNWVSPYTYTHLMSQFPATSGITTMSLKQLRAAAPAASEADRNGSRRAEGERRPEWIRVQMPKLFLGLSIDRDRSVVRRPSFHFPAFSARPSGRSSGFTVELLDEAGKVLTCQPLYDECKHCRAGCWPKSFREVIPFYSEARKLIVWEGTDKIYEEDIPTPPLVKVTCEYVQAENEFEVKWMATDAGGEGAELWYLVQWQDGEDTWRGVAPRTQDLSIRIPAKLIGRRRPELSIRVLATSGIATGVGTCTIQLRKTEIPGQDIVPLGEMVNGAGTPSILQVAVIDEDGGSVPAPDLAWYDDRGTEIGRGRSIDLNTLREGQHVVKAVALGRGREAAERSWLVERRADGTLDAKALPNSRHRGEYDDEHEHAKGPCDVQPHSHKNNR